MNNFKPSFLDIIRGWFIPDQVATTVVWWSDKIRTKTSPDATTLPLAGPPSDPSDLTRVRVRLSDKLWETVNAHRTQVHGPDVSHHQGMVDWSVIHGAGASFAFCKATEGYGYRDSRFKENWAGMKEAGLIRGAYHFARANVSNPNASPAKRLTSIRADAYREAKWFCETVYPNESMPAPGDLPLCLDIEWDSRCNATPSEIVAYCVEFTKVVEARTGRKPIVYTGPNFWKYKLDKSLELSDCHLWLVSGYKGKPGSPRKVIYGWDWTFDQYTNRKPRPDRSEGFMDWNVFRGTLSDLADMAGIPCDALPGA
jgi:lysozyme